MAEIAQKLGKTVKAIESKLSRARLAFQKEYAKEFSIANFQFSKNKKARKILDSFSDKRELSSWP